MARIETPAHYQSLFEVLDEATRSALDSRLRPRAYKRGQTVFSDGDLGDCLHLVRRGRFGVQSTTLAGQTIILRVVHPGEQFGELSLVHPNHRRTGGVVALEASESLALYRNDFEDLRRAHPAVDRFLVGALAERVVRTSELALELMMPPQSRLWRRLAVLADAYGDEPIRLSQDALAHAAGTVRQTANRILQLGVRDGVLSIERGAIRVIDRAALDRLATT